MSGFGGAIKLTGESEYKRALAQINQSLRETSSEMKAVTSSYDSNDKSLAKLSAQEEVLNKKLSEQEQKLNILKTQYSNMESAYSQQTQKHEALVKTYNEEKAKLEEIGRTLGTSSKEYKEQEQKVADLTEEVEKSTKKEEDNERSMSRMRQQINLAQADCNKTAKEIDNLGKETEESGKQAEKSGQGFTVFKGIVADLGASAIRAAISGIKQLGSALVSIGKSAIENYAQFEQLEGGIDTLFKNSADQVMQYANSAYATMGLSANQYMETVTGFSASLIQSLDKDTAKAAEVGNMAITDMADNASKMGTSMESLQNAYQGFAKQNYTMLDNLKLGYGGTKSEMERLLQDATAISGVEYDISSLSDVYEAIHVIQGELGITGNAADEASKTIEGSVNAMKASWTNLLTGLADDNADFESLITNFIDSLMTAAQNILPRIMTVMDGIATLVTELINTLLPEVINMINENSEQMIESATNLITALGDGILQALPVLAPIVFQIITQIITNLVGALPQIIQIGMQILIQLINGLNQTLPTLITMLPTIIKTVVMVLTKNLPLIIKAGCELLIGIINGLMQALPELVEYLPEIIDAICNTLIEMLPLIIDASIQIMMALIDGIIKTLPQLVSSIAKIIPKIVSTLVSMLGLLIAGGAKIMQSLVKGIQQRIPDITSAAKNIGTTITTALSAFGDKVVSIGADIVSGIWDGIINSMSWLKGKITGWVGDVTSFIKKMFKIGSPSKVMADEVGQWLAKGVGVGFEDEMTDVASQMADAIPTSFDVSASANGLSGQTTEYDIINYFKQALSEMKIELDGEVAGAFVDSTVSRLIYT